MIKFISGIIIGAFIGFFIGICLGMTGEQVEYRKENMTEKELSKYFYLKKEVKRLENQLEEFGSGVSATSYEEKVGSSGLAISLQEKRALLIEKLVNARLDALEEYIRIESYIDKVDNPSVKLIMRLRFQDLKSWDEIGIELDKDRTTVAKELRRYLKNFS